MIFILFHDSILGSCSDLMKVRNRCTFTHISVNLWFIFTQFVFFSALFFCRLFTCWWRLPLTYKKTLWKEAGWVYVTTVSWSSSYKTKTYDFKLYYNSYIKTLFRSICIKVLAALRCLNLLLKCLLTNTSLLLQLLVCRSSSNGQTLKTRQFKPLEEKSDI